MGPRTVRGAPKLGGAAMRTLQLGPPVELPMGESGVGGRGGHTFLSTSVARMSRASRATP
eukprot:3842054-Pyramimonas_sp.AAC.1